MHGSNLLIFTVFAMLSLVNFSQGQSANCLSCVYKDSNAGFLTSHSYCQSLDVCLQDAWNYIDYKCSTKWTKGRKIGIDVCGPQETTCPGFDST